MRVEGRLGVEKVDLCFYLVLRAPQRGGFPWDILETVPLYDEIAHVTTPFTLVAITAETIYRFGGATTSFSTYPPRPDHG
jgi:hypothetical protein